MKTLFFTLLGIFIFITFSCKKSNNATKYNLVSVQHKWMLVSHNGETLRYIGRPEDYYNFSTDNFLYTYVDKVYDTVAYVLLSNSNMLSLYPVMNGVRSNVATNYEIKVLDNSQFILWSSSIPGINILDSLKR